MNKQDEEKAEELYPDFKRDLLYQNRVKSLQRKAFIQGAAWKEEQMIEKAVEWLNKVAKDAESPYVWYDSEEGFCGIEEQLIEDFKQAMKGE